MLVSPAGRVNTHGMLLFAVSALEKMQTLKPEVWFKIGIAVVAFIVVVILARRIMQMNKIIAGVGVFVVGSVVFFSWVYNRNEPKFLTPIVEKIAPFFPSAGAYNAKQQKTPKP
jgi:glucan phosphoethanolaminetransferase (alkaline phosphatase superfamily)